MNNLNNRNSKR